MKNILSILTLTALLCSAGDLSAQQGEQHQQGKPNMTTAERAEHQTVKMKHHLKLNDDQASKVGEINARYADKLESIRGMEEGRREAATELKDARNAELKSVLTEEQYASMIAEQEKNLKKKQGQQAQPGPARTK